MGGALVHETETCLVSVSELHNLFGIGLLVKKPLRLISNSNGEVFKILIFLLS